MINDISPKTSFRTQIHYEILKDQRFTYMRTVFPQPALNQQKLACYSIVTTRSNKGITYESRSTRDVLNLSDQSNLGNPVY